MIITIFILCIISIFTQGHLTINELKIPINWIAVAELILIIISLSIGIIQF